MSLALLAAVATVGAGGCPEPVAEPVAALELKPCGEDIVAAVPPADWSPQMQVAARARLAKLECGVLDVPLDHDEPDEQHIGVPVVRLKATDPLKRRGTLTFNPGGPGGGGVQFWALYAALIDPKIRASYDLVGFDPRGVAEAKNVWLKAGFPEKELSGVVELQCGDPANRPLPAPEIRPVTDKAGKTWFLDHFRAEADKCTESATGKAFNPHINTRQTARDIDALRAALGEEKISYIGVSYGTYLGAVYGKLFPEHVDRMVLDSSMDPRPDHAFRLSGLAQSAAFTTRIEEFFAWAAKGPDEFRLGDTSAAVRANWQAAMEKIRTTPVTVTDPAKPQPRSLLARTTRGLPAGAVMGPAELDSVLAMNMYAEFQWPGLAKALSAYVNQGDGSALAALADDPRDPKGANSASVQNTVACSDSTYDSPEKTFKQIKQGAEKIGPFVWNDHWLNCSYWKDKQHEPLDIDGEDLPPLLLLQSTGDPATPYGGALEMHKALPSSRMIVEEGFGDHGVYGYGIPGGGANAAIDPLVTGYLLGGDVPATDLRCTTRPRVTPSGAKTGPEPACAPVTRSHPLPTTEN